MTDNFSNRRQHVRMPTEIQGKIDAEKCFISNLSGGGAMVLSTFNGKIGQEVLIQFTYNQSFFEKKGIIRAANSISQLRSPINKKNFMYALSIAFTESITANDFFFLEEQ